MPTNNPVLACNPMRWCVCPPPPPPIGAGVQAMQPWVHYVPVDRTLSDLAERYQWLRDNDAEARKIGNNGRQLARQHLRVEDVYCYHLIALERFAAMQTFEPAIHPGMTEQLDKDAMPPAQCRCPDYGGGGGAPPATKKRGKVRSEGPKLRHEL